MLPPIIASMMPALAGGVVSGFGAMMANNEARAASQRQMDFQKETLQNSFQWGMQDMSKAGLNPILAYQRGGAGSAGGSTYTPQNVGSNSVTGGSTAASSALAMKFQEQQLENLAADTMLKNSQDRTQDALRIQALAQAGQANSNSALSSFQAKLSQAQAEKARTETLLIGENIHSARAAASRSKADEEFFDSETGQWVRKGGTIMRELNPFFNKLK